MNRQDRPSCRLRAGFNVYATSFRILGCALEDQRNLSRVAVDYRRIMAFLIGFFKGSSCNKVRTMVLFGSSNATCTDAVHSSLDRMVDMATSTPASKPKEPKRSQDNECRDLRCHRTEPHAKHLAPEATQQCSDPYCNIMTPHAAHD